MGKIEYIKAFHVAIGPGKAVLPLGLAWANTGQPVEVAIAWARRNYLPDEALPRIEAGLTPEQAAAIDDALIEEHGAINAALMQLQLDNPAAVILVDPAVPDLLAHHDNREGEQPMARDEGLPNNAPAGTILEHTTWEVHAEDPRRPADDTFRWFASGELWRGGPKLSGVAHDNYPDAREEASDIENWGHNARVVSTTTTTTVVYRTGT